MSRIMKCCDCDKEVKSLMDFMVNHKECVEVWLEQEGYKLSYMRMVEELEVIG